MSTSSTFQSRSHDWLPWYNLRTREAKAGELPWAWGHPELQYKILSQIKYVNNGQSHKNTWHMFILETRLLGSRWCLLYIYLIAARPWAGQTEDGRDTDEQKAFAITYKEICEPWDHYVNQQYHILVQNKPWVSRPPGLNPVASLTVCISFGQYLNVAKLQHTQSRLLSPCMVSVPGICLHAACRETAVYLLHICFILYCIVVFPVAAIETLHKSNLKKGRTHHCREVLAAGVWGI